MRRGTGCNFPRWSPTLSGLMSVLSMPVLTMSLSRLQFLLAIATRLPFWPGPADLKCRVTLFGLDQPSESKIFKIYPDQVAWHVCLQNTHVNTHPHNEGIWTCISTEQMCTEQRHLLGITSYVIFIGGVDFFYSSVAEGKLSHPVHASPHARG